MTYERSRGTYRVSTDPARLDLDVIHGFLSSTYWSPDVAREVVERSIRHSLPFGLYEIDDQIGFARVITDYATFAYLADVFVLASHQRRGLGVFLVESIIAHPELQGLRRWMLATRDAHELYRRFGFAELAEPEKFMERRGSRGRPSDTT